jgi:hypothetical protein
MKIAPEYASLGGAQSWMETASEAGGALWA